MGLEKVSLDASCSASPCPLWLHNLEPFQIFRLLIPLTILQRLQDLRVLPVSSQTLAFFSFSRLLNPTPTKWCLPHVHNFACCVTLKIHRSRCFGPYIPLLTPELTAEQSLVKLDTGKYISFLTCPWRLFQHCIRLCVLFCYCRVAGNN